MTQKIDGLFITGTDTGVGKTVVTAAIARTLRSKGYAVSVCKPVVTGARWTGDRWVGEDTEVLAEAAGTPGAFDEVTAWAFPDPVAPTVAARLQGQALNLPCIEGSVRKRIRPGSLALVEGVGGLLCPLTETATVADLIHLLQLPVVVVARRSLGTLNHTLLTLEAAQNRQLHVVGVVVNEVTPSQGLAEETNIEELAKRIKVPILAVMPYLHERGTAAISAIDRVDWRQLCKGNP